MSNNMENMLMNMNDSDSDSDEDNTNNNAGAVAVAPVAPVAPVAVNPPVALQPPTITTTSSVPIPNPVSMTQASPMIEPIPVVQPKPMMGPPPTITTTKMSHYQIQQQQQQPRQTFEPSMLDIEPTPLRDIQAAQSKTIPPVPQPVAPLAAAGVNTSTTQMRNNNTNHPMHAHALHKPHMSLPTQSHSQSLPTHPNTSSSSHVTSTSSLSATDHKSRKEQFLMFTRVLMKYLDKQDPNMHTHAKQVIRECAQKNRNGDPGYSSLSISMQKRLKQLVGDVYWHKATEYLAKYFKDQYMKTGRMTEDQARRKAHEHARLAASDLSIDYNNVSSTSTTAMTTGAVTTTGTATTSSSRYTPLSSSRMNAPTMGTTSTTHDKQQQQQPYNRVVPPPILTNIAKTPSSKRTATPTTTEKKKKTYTKKGSVSNTPTSMTQASLTGGTTTAAAAAANAAANREYNILMEMVHHVVDYDVKSCGLILNHESKVKGDLNLSEEQKQLVYGDFGIPTSTPQQQRNVSSFQKGLYSGPQSIIQSIPSYMKGWGSRNVLSVRAAWAKLRLEEDERYELEQSSLVLPGVVDLVETIKDETTTTSHDKSPYEWFNEEEAEEDDTLALISEATQYYLRTILQGAMHAASQRLNLDGIRLWHAQHQAADKGVDQDSIPFSLRLGCDVQRQVALAQGNAAKTCQRMEEALARSSGSKGDIDYDILCNTSSMMELSKIPVISSAAAKAEESAKRSFEIYGGKYSGDPPFGRVPKKAKIMVKDLNVCLSNTAFAVKKKGFLYRLH